MSVSIPSELQPFIQQELAKGESRSVEELVAKALVLYQEMKTQHNELQSRVQRSLEQADRGEVSEIDIETVIARGYERLKIRTSGYSRRVQEPSLEFIIQ